jgi:hypothetical protein
MKNPNFYLRVRFVQLPVIAALISALASLGSVAHGQEIFLDAGFEGSSSLPTGWTQNQISDTSNWSIQGGGNSANPAAAHGGSNNAHLFTSNYVNNQNELISPVFDTTGHINISFTFWHTQTVWGPDQDELKVFYSSNGGSTWTELVNYTSSVAAWTERILTISLSRATTCAKFEGIAKWGYGICLDDIKVSGVPDALYCYC